MLYEEYKNLGKLVSSSYERPSLIFVSGEWLGSTVLMRTILNVIENKLEDPIDFYEIKFENPYDFEKSDFSKLPTIILVCEEEYKFTQCGIIPKNKLKQEILNFLAAFKKRKSTKNNHLN